MAEILTESFCERCGTRYTFESAAPVAAKRLGKFKVLSKGLKNFVMDDDASLDEALAAARSEAEGESTSQQLDAFHQTFNFCMSCRQYTCSKCWNEADGRCLTCAPLLGGELLEEQAPTPLGVTKGRSGRAAKAAAKKSVDALAWPTTDLRRFENAQPPTPEPVRPAKRMFDEPAPPVAEAAVDAAAPIADAAPLPVDGNVVVPEEWPDIPSLADRLRMVSGPVDEPAEPEPAAAAAAAAPPVAQPPAPAEPVAAEGDDAPTAVGRFRPGQSLDAVLDAFEAERFEKAAEIDAEISRKRAARLRAQPPPEPIAPEPEPEPYVPEPEAEAESIAAAPEPERRPSPRSDGPDRNPRRRVSRDDDRVEVPTWRITAPEPSPAPPPADPRHPIQPTAASAQAGRAQGKPEWPNEPAVDNLAFLANRGGAERSVEEVWAASSRDVIAAPGSPTAPAGVQACVSCGLSLSATARFCRRCGTRQGG
jgi:hypothetical protein